MFWLAEGRQRAQWPHTAAILHQIVALLTPGLSPEDFDPFTAMDRGEQPAAIPPEQSAANWRSLGLAFGNPRD